MANEVTEFIQSMKYIEAHDEDGHYDYLMELARAIEKEVNKLKRVGK